MALVITCQHNRFRVGYEYDTCLDCGAKVYRKHHYHRLCGLRIKYDCYCVHPEIPMPSWSECRQGEAHDYFPYCPTHRKIDAEEVVIR